MLAYRVCPDEYSFYRKVTERWLTAVRKAKGRTTIPFDLLPCCNLGFAVHAPGNLAQDILQSLYRT